MADPLVPPRRMVATPPPVPVPPAWNTPPLARPANPATRTSSMKEPLAERLRPARLRRQWVAQQWRNTPCWLTSLVAHLALVVLLGMMILPARDAWHNPLTLLASLTDEDDLHDEAAHVFVTTARQPEHEGDPATRRLRPDEAPRAQQSSSDKAAAAARVQQQGAAVLAGASSLVTSIRETFAADDNTASGATRRATSRHPGAEYPEQEHNTIVNDFILYDIGRLKGEAGRQAAKRFHALGPEALPALVRGLNRSASIAASCPVGVLTYKVLETAAVSDDPAAVDYVLDNLGRDVPPEAPHSERLKNLAKNFQNLIDARRERARRERERIVRRQQQFRDRLARHGYHVDDEALVQIDALFTAGDQIRIAKTAKSDNPHARRNAMLAIALRYPVLRRDTDEEHLALGQLAIGALTDDDRAVRVVALDVVERFFQRSDLGITADSSALERAELRDRALVQLREHIARINAQGKATGELAMADQLAAAGRFDKARERYRRIIRDHEGSIAAQAARHRLEQLQDRE